MKFRMLFAAACLTAISLTAAAGCSSYSSSTTASTAAPSVGAASTATYTDDLQRSVTIKSIPQRIVSLSPSNTELVYALGLQNRLVGITSYDNYPPDVTTKTVVSDYSTVDMEKIAAVQPDLVLADSIQKDTAIPALEKLNIPVFTLTPLTMDMIFKDLATVGQIEGKAKESNDLVSSLQARVKAVSTRTAALAANQKPRVLYVTWHDPIWTAGGDTMIQELIDLSGGTNIASDLKGYTTITLEAAIQRNPQAIIVMSSMGAGNQSLDFIKTNAQFQSTDALKNGRVYEVDADIFGRTSPRIVDGLETLSKMLHPELFK